MADSVPLNSVEIPNTDRVRIAEMYAEAQAWPNAEIRGIVRAGGYEREEHPQRIAAQRAGELKNYLIQLGIKEDNIWTDLRVVSARFANVGGKFEPYQIAVTMVPICDGGCERLCNESRIDWNSKAIK
ncbi:hypothetical protein AB4Y32_15655 [Paraburkholderia phymatum]|uniref:Uncharacterized protein n=1 Tax=Paraburkholderia phymatum TaxID=148447 RepID=A0ACC6U0W9_9BURK